jgi:flagellar basal-body rod protein FlgG
MLKSMANSYTGLRAHQQMLDVTAHNLANVNTVAYKERLVSFQELLYRNLAERRLPVAGEAPLPPRGGRGVALAGTVPSSREGSLNFTGKQFDLALAGEGFFRVVRPDGSYAYTRSGNFGLDAEGRLVTAGGDRLDFTLNLPATEKIEPFDPVITPQGEIYIQASSPIEKKEGESSVPEENEGEQSAPGLKVGEIFLYRFTNPQGLSSVGENLLLPSANSGPPQEGKAGENGFGLIQQGFLESSNVDLAGQMVKLIRGQRALQASIRTLTAADELWAQTLNLQI